MPSPTSYTKKLVVFILINISMICIVQAISGNNSEIPGNLSASRLAYYRWRKWLMSRPAILEKLPPIPRTEFATECLDIYVMLNPATIFHIDAAQQTVHMSVTVMLWWQDHALAVNQNLVEEFTDGNVTVMPSSMSLQSQAVWLPRMIFTEGVNSLFFLHEVDEVSVNQNGLIRIVLPFILTLSCRFHMNAYPFDEHYCPITLIDVSVSANIYPAGLVWDSTFSEEFGVSGEWDLVNVTEKTIINSSSGGLVYPQFVLHLRRKTTFYSVVILFPMVLTYLNTLVFLLPPDLGDKASYLVTLTVSMSVYSAFFISDMPRGLESMPRILVLLIFVYVESFCIMLLCLAFLRKYASEQQQATEVGITSCAPSMCKGTVASEQSDENNVNGQKHSSVSAKQLESIFFVTGFVLHTVVLTFIFTSMLS